MATIAWISYDPPQFELAGFTGVEYTGEISIRIKDVQILVLDLGMGGMVPGNPGYYATTDCQIAVMTVENIPIGTLIEAMNSTAHLYEKMDKIVRKKFKEKGLLNK
jgi:hypothetical protein